MMWPMQIAETDIRVEAERDGAARVGVWRSNFNSRTVFLCLLVFAGYYLGAKLGFALTFQPHPVSVMWPPNSILLAALLLSPTRLWWVLLLAAFPAHLLAEVQGGVPFKMVLCWFISNSCEALIGATGTRFLIGRPQRYDAMRSISILFLCGGFLGPLLSSFLDSAFVSLNHWGNQSYWHVWRMRLCSNIFAALILVPVILSWGTSRITSLRTVSHRRFVEAGIVFSGLLSVSIIVLCWQESGPTTIPTLLYAPLPFLLWAAVRFGLLGTSTGILFVALLAIWGAVHGRGPFASHSPEENALSIQALFIVISIMLTFLVTSIAERAKAEERFTKAFHSSPDAIAIAHIKDGHIVEVNERWEKMFGYLRNETIGRTLFDLSIHPFEADREKLMAGISAGNGWHDMELCLRTQTGELRHTLVSADSEDIGSEPCLIITVRDITDRKRAEEMQQNLAHASRLAVVGELTAMIAHEVNQPLGAILSNADAAEMLLERGKPQQHLNEIRQVLSDIRKDNLRASEAIRRIRALLRKREMQMQPLDLNETISDVLRLVAGDALRRRVQIRRELGQDLPLVTGDRVHLQQVLLNLIVNAMDAMNHTDESARRITVQTKQNSDGSIQVAIKDSGHGIALDKMACIFESFFTTKQDGMGLGLPIARSIVEAHQGHLWAENNSGGGATFNFTVPVAENATRHETANIG